MNKRKVSLGGGAGPAATSRGAGPAVVSTEVLELFFGTGVVHHEVALPSPLPDVVSGFKVVEGDEASGFRVRPADAGEDPDVEISAIEHLAELSGRWLPCPYQLSCSFAVQIHLQLGSRPGTARALLAIDTSEAKDSKGAMLDASLDAGRPFRPLAKGELGRFLDDPSTRQLVRELGKEGIERAPFKLAALLEMLAPLLPRLELHRLEERVAVPVSLVLDLGNSRSSALLVESDEGATRAMPLEIRDSGNPFAVSDDAFGSRLTFMPSPFDADTANVAVGGAFQLPSLVRMGREALDRALETPHRYQCSLSGPKRYLWDARPTEERWHFAGKHAGAYRPVAGLALRHLADHGDALVLREDGPQTPADPRYAPRGMMLFALVELLQQAFAQINGAPYRRFQGKEGSPRVLSRLTLTYPSAMPEEEREVYETLVTNAVVLASHYLRIPHERRPNWNAATGRFARFVEIDEALAAQMVFVYQEIVHRFGGSMEELVRVLGRPDPSGAASPLRIASIDLGGGTTDVTIAEYVDRVPGAGTALHVRTLFQDGVSIAGDDVCRALVEDLIVDQMLAQLPTPLARRRFVLLFVQGDAGHGAAWRTLKAKLVPSFWLPLARCFWAIGEGAEIAGHVPEKTYAVQDALRAFAQPALSSAVCAEADAFLSAQVPGWPGLSNFVLRFDADAIDRAVLRVLREPLRRYADVIAQFDVDLLLLAGRTSKLRAVRELLVGELPVAPARIVPMAGYPVSDWYPSRWRHEATIADPKTTVASGAAILHQALANRLPGLVVEGLEQSPARPVLGLYQSHEPHVPRASELFREGPTSPPFLFTRGMRIGARLIDSEEMHGAPLYEVVATSPAREDALLAARARVRFRQVESGRVEIAEILATDGAFAPEELSLRLRTATSDRYWLDTGALEVGHRWLDASEEG